MVLIAVQKQEGNMEERQIQNTSSAPSAELDKNSTPREDISVESGT